MKKTLKIFSLMLATAILLLSLAGCMEMRYDVEIRSDGTGTMTSKVMIDEETYLLLSALENDDGNVDDPEGDENQDINTDDNTASDENEEDNASDTDELTDEDTNADNNEDASEDTNEDETTDEEPSEEPSEDNSNLQDTVKDVDWTKYTKETIDGEVYYVLTETKEFASYEDLAAALMADANDGSPVFTNVQITKDGNKYSFNATTPVMSDEYAALGAEGDWLKVSMTVKMPGKITETNGEKLDNSTVRFDLTEFDSEQTLSVESKMTLSEKEIVALVGIALILGGTVAFLVWRKKKYKHF